MPNNTTGRSTKPKQTTTATKAKNSTSKAKDKPIKDNVIDIKAKPEAVVKYKPRGGNSPVIGDNGIDTKPGDNSKYAAVLLELSQWPKPDRADISALEDRFIEYLQYCQMHDIKVGNQMAYLALGLTKDNVYDMENGRSMGSSHSDFIKKVKLICAGTRELLMQDGKVNPILGIFWQKNYDGLKDTQDLVITPNSTLQPTMSMEEIAEKVKSDVVIDADYNE